MQFKRDTDYALRIVFCVANYADRADSAPAGLSLSEIGQETRLAKLSAARVCGYLAEGGILVPNRAAEPEKRFLPAEDFWQKSLLDIVVATEGNAELFSVFDKHSPMFQGSAKAFRQMEQRVRAEMARLTVEKLWRSRRER